MPDGGQRGISFSVMATPGGCARDLRAELVATVLPRTPDAICIGSPGNCMTACRTVQEAGDDFAQLLQSALERCSTVRLVFKLFLKISFVKKLLCVIKMLCCYLTGLIECCVMIGFCSVHFKDVFKGHLLT